MIVKIISQTKNGRVFICPSCSQIHFEYKNLNFNFDKKEDYKYFADYFLKLKGEYWENQNSHSLFKRKIIVPIGHKNFHIILNNVELLELKTLLGQGSKKHGFPFNGANFYFCEN